MTTKAWRTIQQWTWILPVGLAACLAAGQENQPGPVYKVGGDVTAPRRIFTPEPTYAAEAWGKRITGEVSLTLNVLPDGTTNNIRVVKSLDPGLDQSAVETVGHWRFEPATKFGIPVSVEIGLVVNFRIPATVVSVAHPGPGVYHVPCAPNIDSRDIKDLLKKAYKGEAKAQFIIGCACEYGVARQAPDRAQAIDWYRKAAESLVPAQYFLGETYLSNFDYVNAYRWLKIASSGGYIDPHDRLKTVALLLSKEQLGEAEEQVAAWKRQHGTN
ncbi:MAG: TonB family protein [Terriglobales bacterium]|jgi:TonB family protein